MGTTYPGLGVNFNSGAAESFTVYRSMRMFITDASICDTSGQLLFYTNGVYIANRNHDTLENCENFNPGYSTNFYDEAGLGHTQAAMIIPKPGSLTDYYIFHTTAENLVYKGVPGTYPVHLSCTEIDMTADSGLGGVNLNFKNVHVVEDTLYKGRIAGCKHANGRDWWVVVKEMTTNRYYKLLVTPEGVSDPVDQSIGFNGYFGNIYGMAVFSPDGNKYAHLDINDTISYMQFDRCSGEFYNQLVLAVPDSPISLSATLGCQFSPNSRFLYVNSYRRLWQFDTWASDVQSSMLLIDTTNNFEDKFLQQLAPDGKIYIGTFNSNGLNPFLNVIHDPDNLGIACNFEIAGLTFPTPSTTNSAIPNFPNYDLGALFGSACDTLTTVDEIKGSPNEISISPNPANQIINIVYSVKNDCVFELMDVKGVVRQRITLFHYFKNRMLWVNDLENGIYFYRVVSNKEILQTGKIAVVR